MNIFVLDLDPIKAAESHCDRHVVKMILESCQILSTVMHKHGEIGVYKPTHQNHPCVVWAGASKQNFLWLKSLMTHLCREYTKRYGKHHKCEAYLSQLTPPTSLPKIQRTPFALAMPEKYRQADPVESYREYYSHEKAHFAKWRLGDAPAWWAL